MLIDRFLKFSPVSDFFFNANLIVLSFDLDVFEISVSIGW